MMERSGRRFSAARLGTVARELLDASPLCAMATVGSAGRAHIHTAQFAWSDAFELVWMSDSDTDHSHNLRVRPTTAVAVYDSTQGYGQPGRGIQLFGSARVAQDRQASELFESRFPAYSGVELPAYRVWRFRPRRMKLLHESALGIGLFVTARVGRGGAITWTRTERLRPDR